MSSGKATVEDLEAYESDRSAGSWERDPDID
ncbi:hypothetical protein FHR93_002442 [Geodermatophilus sabuli]|nr:hypothetical protein [Geodermatophilus sabuli]